MKKISLLNRRGFTLMELVVAIGIIGVVLTAISSFLISNMKAFNYADDQIQAQYQAQAAVNSFIDKAMGTKGIEDISLDGNNLQNVVLLKLDGGYLTIRLSNGALEYGDGDPPMDYKPVASGISEFEVELMPEPKGIVPTDSEKKACRGLKITCTSRINNSSVSVSNEFYFRNK